ncbi:MAG: LamB/YcsF family protein, partial [Cytophagales bacterium]|nr:LamB/YcsF family protein [Cytophagales bacterium]
MNSFKKIPINCDLGEGMPDDAAIIPFIDEANIACGFHAGDSLTMRTTIAHCLSRQVKIGAHSSYLDRENFGRIVVALSPSEIYQLV